MFPKLWPNKSNNTTDENRATPVESVLKEPPRETTGGLERIQAQLDSMRLTSLSDLATFSFGGVGVLSVIFLYTRFGKRIRNADWITPDLFAKKRWIRGIVTR